VTAYFHPTPRCLEIVAQLLSDDDSKKKDEDMYANTTKPAAGKTVNTEEQTQQKPVQRIFLDVAKLVDLNNKRVVHGHMNFHRQSLAQTTTDQHHQDNFLLASASVDSIDSTLGPSSSFVQQQQQQEFLRLGSLDSLSVADNMNEDDNRFLIPEQAHQFPSIHRE
jgi:hypothetical protein